MREKYKIRITTYFVIVTQFILYFLLYLPLRLKYKTVIKSRVELESIVKGSFLISNHRTRFDAYLVMGHLPLKVFLRIFPIRVPTAVKYYYDWRFNPKFFPVLTLCGGVPVGLSAEDAMKTVFLIRDLIRHGQTVLIFPEGKISNIETVSEFRRGIDFLVREAPMALLVRIKIPSGEIKGTVTLGSLYKSPINISHEEMEKYILDM